MLAWKHVTIRKAGRRDEAPAGAGGVGPLELGQEVREGARQENLHERSQNVYENKRESDTMPERKADISAYLGDLRVTFVPNCTENGLHYGVRRTLFAQK